MYIAAAYQNFIDLQNAFLNGLIEPLKLNGILNNFVNQMEKTIDVQKAKKNEALNFDVIDEVFMETIFENSKRNIYKNDNSINYMNYKQYIYDFGSIEKKLGEKLLPGKVKFNDHEHLKFVTFCFEGFRGNKTSVLSVFALKYKQIVLSLEKKQIIYDSIKDKIQVENEDLSKILFSIQLLIYYLTQELKKDSDDIKDIIEELPDYVTISKECVDFFQKQKITVAELIELYSYIELLCFKPIIKNLRKHYKQKIDVDKAEKINKLFDERKIKIITKTSLATACRKLISRYLVSTRDDTDFSENNKLDLYLKREELWNLETWKNLEDKITQELDILGKEELTLGQSYELYNLLGGDEKIALEGIQLKNEEDKQDNDEKANEDLGEQKIIKKDKKKKRIKY
jgi:hypothetical protein